MSTIINISTYSGNGNALIQTIIREALIKHGFNNVTIVNNEFTQDQLAVILSDFENGNSDNQTWARVSNIPIAITNNY